MPQHKRKEAELTLRLLPALRAEIRAGIDDIARGDFVEIGAEELDSYFDKLSKKHRECARRALRR